MVFRKIDKQGNYLGQVILDKHPMITETQMDVEGNPVEVQVPDPLYRTEPFLQGAYRAKFNFTTGVFEEAKVFTEEEILAIKMQEVEIKRIECEQRIVSGFESNCLGVVKHFDCQPHDQSNILGLALTATLGVNGMTTEEVKWKASDEMACYPFTYEQALQLAFDMKAHIQGNIDQYHTERKAILEGV